ncbi:integrase, catalytic region, zinc finger, CCHC-type containing protein [Tanacetum coccineum]|uniref:Integrase, catalytic region, zinc finger, CCHC-type containing protein n=1 Tax=Tanacetum coccineum TaxID=301880 RepID=A0ABQ5AZU2_9ASTR
MQQPLPNPNDISDPTTAMNMELVLMAKTFKLNYSTPTNNNQRISSNPHNRLGTMQGKLQGIEIGIMQCKMQGIRLFRISSESGYSETVWAEGNGNGNNGNQIRCYNYKGLGHYASNCIVRPRRRDAAYLQTQLLIYQKEKAGAAAGNIYEIDEVNSNCILMANLQQASTSGTQTDKAPVYDSDGSTESDINVISVDSSVEHSGGIVEQQPATVEETRVENTAKTRRPQPRSNTKNDRVPSASKSSYTKNKEVEVEDHLRNLLLSKNRKHMAVQIYLWCVNSGCSKHMTGNMKLLINFVWKFMGTVRFGNDHVAAIMGYGDL